MGLDGLSLTFFEMELSTINWRLRVLLYLNRRRLMKVEGDSMLPTLRAGDVVLIDPSATIGNGDIVVADHPYMQSVTLVKRVDSIDDRGRFILKGDNPDASTDSRTYGSIAKGDITGKVICKYNYS